MVIGWYCGVVFSGIVDGMSDEYFDGKQFARDVYGEPESETRVLSREPSYVMEKELEREKFEVEVDLDKLGRQGDENDVRKGVAKAVGLIEMVTSKASFEGGEHPQRGLMLRVENDGVHQVVTMENLAKAMPEMSSMVGDDGRHWSLNGLSVSASSTPEEWARFFGSIRIKRKRRKKR